MDVLWHLHVLFTHCDPHIGLSTHLLLRLTSPWSSNHAMSSSLVLTNQPSHFFLNLRPSVFLYLLNSQEYHINLWLLGGFPLTTVFIGNLWGGMYCSCRLFLACAHILSQSPHEINTAFPPNPVSQSYGVGLILSEIQSEEEALVQYVDHTGFWDPY